MKITIQTEGKTEVVKTVDEANVTINIQVEVPNLKNMSDWANVVNVGRIEEE